MARAVPIKYVIGSDVATKYVNNVVIHYSPDGDFYLSFFEIVPPIIMADTEEEKQKQLQEIPAVDARCVGRISLTKERVRSLIGALVQQLKRVEEGYEQHTMELEAGPQTVETKHAG